MNSSLPSAAQRTFVPLLALALSLACLAPVSAQERAPAKSRAPTWKIGQWWEVAVYRESIQLMPQGPPVRAFPVEPLEGLAGLGPRSDFFELARWRFTVERFEWLDAGEGVATPGWFVAATKLSARPETPTFLFVFVGEEKALSDIALRRPGKREAWFHFDADAHDQAPFLFELQGLFFAWPDLRAPDPNRPAALKGCYELQRVRQREREDDTGRWYQVQEIEPQVGGVVTIRWRPGEPWWAEALSSGWEVKLLRTSSDPAPAGEDEPRPDAPGGSEPQPEDR